MTRLSAAIKGDLQKYMAEEVKTAELAITDGVRETATAMRDALRGDIVAGGLGNRLSKSWRTEFYPKRGPSLSAAALVFTNAPKLIEAFDTGATIRSQDGFWLAIPTPSAPKMGVGRKRISPSNWPEARFGKLRFVFRRTGPSLLVVDDQRQRKSGGFAVSKSKKALATKSGLATVPMFLLYRQTRLERRLNVASVMAQQEKNLLRNVDAAFVRRDATAKGGE